MRGWVAKEVSAKMFKTIQVGLEDYDGCEIPLERMDDFEPEETYIIPNPVLPDDTHEDEQGELWWIVFFHVNHKKPGGNIAERK